MNDRIKLQPASVRHNELIVSRRGSARSERLILAMILLTAITSQASGAAIQPETSAAEDVVYVLDRQTNESKARPGKIVNFNQKFLELETSEGRSVKLPANEVRRIQTKYSQAYQTAQQQIAEGSFDKALSSLDQALKEDQREWVLREILAQRVSVAKLLGQSTLACQSFLLIAKNEPDHRHWSIAPLPWHAETADLQLEQVATDWLESEQPAEQLLGAAWLLNGTRQDDAERKLKELTRSRTDAIGQLASVQLWRLPSVGSSQRIAQWQATLERLPQDVRPGPEYLLGRLLAQQKQYDLAAAMFMRVRILHAECYELNAMSLFEANRSLQAAGHPEEAQRVLLELKQAFPDSFWAKQASP